MSISLLLTFTRFISLKINQSTGIIHYLVFSWWLCQTTYSWGDKSSYQQCQTFKHLNQLWHSTQSTSGYNVLQLAFIPSWCFSCLTKRRKTTWSSKFRLCFPALQAPLSPLSSIIFFPSCPFSFLFFRFEASPEDAVNGLTSQLLLKQCGLGPLFALCV